MLVFVVAPVVLLTATYVTLLVSDYYWLERETEVAREKGYPLTVEELEAEYPTSPEIEAATAHWQKAIEIVGSEDYKQATVGAPIVYVQPNQYPPVEEPLPLSEERLATVRRFVDEQADVLAAARAARESGSVARFPFEFEKLIHADISHAEGLRDVSKLLRLDLEVRLADGDADAAFENLLTQIAVADSLTNEPNLITQMTRMALLSTAIDSTTETLSRIDLTDDRLAQLQQAFARQLPMEGYVKALRAERYMASYLTRFDSPIDDPKIELHPFPIFANSDIAKQYEFLGMLEEAATSDSPDLADGFSDVDVAVDEFVHTTSTAGLRYYFTCTVLSMTETASHAFVGAVAKVRVAETAIAAERYRIANGSWPRRPEDLVPEYLEDDPIDPFVGEPLVLRIESDFAPPDQRFDETSLEPRGPGLLSMSVGPNRVNDGGDHRYARDLPLFLPDRSVERAAPRVSDDDGQSP